MQTATSRSSRVHLALAFVATAACATACGSSPDGAVGTLPSALNDGPSSTAPSGAPQSAGTPGSAIVSRQSALPSYPSGLMMRAGKPPASENFMSSSVVMIDWSDLQPTATGPFQWATLDQALSILPSAITHIRLRIMSGGSAPAWVKRLGNAQGFTNGVMTAIDCSEAAQGSKWGGVAVQNVQGPTACVPFFWTAPYMTAYQNLLTGLKARLATNPKYNVIDTIVDSACMAVYAEVFYRGQGDALTNKTLYDAGLTHPADIACQQNAINAHKTVFGASRRTSVAINDWDIVQGTPGGTAQHPGDYHTSIWYDGSGAGATWATYDFAEWARQTLTFGGQTLLEVQNNGLHSTGASCPSGGTGTTSYWCYIAQYHGRHGFQTQSYVDSQTLIEDLNNGLALNAEYVELPGGMSSTDWSKMSCFNDHLVHGDSSPCP